MSIIGIILSSGGVYASAVIAGTSIAYDNKKSGLSSTNIQDAIDEQYRIVSKYKKIIVAYTYNGTSGTSNYCVKGTEDTCQETECYKTRTADSCPAGTLIKYKVNDTEEEFFHVLFDEGNTITMQSLTNVAANTKWYVTSSSNTYGPTTVLTKIEDTTSDWYNVNPIIYTMGTTIFYNNKYTGCSAYNSCTTNKYTLTQRKSYARLITIQEAAALGCTSSANSCSSFLTVGGAYGYWTVKAYSSNTTDAYYIYNSKTLSKCKTNSTEGGIGAKAVVNINKES